ncbi:MAG: hypothetical protein EXX96DRAFT_492167, partial [Benjaminiella poitrasii]
LQWRLVWFPEGARRPCLYRLHELFKKYTNNRLRIYPQLHISPEADDSIPYLLNRIPHTPPKLNNAQDQVFF